MSGLNATLNIALSSLEVSQEALATTSNNVANANTPGYSRQVSDLAAGDPVQIGSLSFGTGVVLQKIESLRDPILEIQLNQATSQNSQLNAQLTQLQQLQTQFSSANSGIGADISNFFNAIQQLSPDPTNLSLRQSILTAAGNLATDFNHAAQSLETQRSNIDLNVTQSVSQINSLAAQLASVNQQISSLQSAGQSSGSLVDTQTNLIRQISALVGVSVVPNGQSINVTLANGDTLVSGSQSFALTTQLGTDGVQHIFSGANDITSSISGGSLGGELQIRDQEILSVSSNLDQLAAGFANAVNTANAQGFDLNGNAGGNIFTPPPAGGAGAAANLSVAITDPTLIAASSDGTSGSNGNLANLSAVASQVVADGQTPIDAYSNIVFQVGSATQNVSADADSSGAILQQLQDERGSVSGVSLNEEASNLIQYQTAYQASARVVSAVNSLLLDAVNLGMDSVEQ